MTTAMAAVQTPLVRISRGMSSRPNAWVDCTALMSSTGGGGAGGRSEAEAGGGGGGAACDGGTGNLAMVICEIASLSLGRSPAKASSFDVRVMSLNEFLPG